MKLNNSTILQLKNFSTSLAKILRANDIRASQGEIFDDLMNIITARANGEVNEVAAKVATPTSKNVIPQHNAAADILCLAFQDFHDGNIEQALKYTTVAFQTDGIEELVQAMESMNNEIEEATSSFNKERDRENMRDAGNSDKDISHMETDDLIDLSDIDNDQSGVPTDESAHDEIDTNHLDDLNDSEDDEDISDEPAFKVDNGDLKEALSAFESDMDDDEDEDNVEEDIDPDFSLDDSDEEEDDDDEDEDSDDDEDEGFEDDDDEALVESSDDHRSAILANMTSLDGSRSSIRMASRILKK